MNILFELTEWVGFFLFKAKFDSEDSFIDDGSLKSSDDDNSIEVICDDGEGEPSTSKRKAKGAETSDDEVVNNWKSRRRGGKENGVCNVFHSDMKQFSDESCPLSCWFWCLADNQAAQPLEAPEAENTWWMEFVPEDMERIDHSGKLVIVFDILKECYAIGDKV